ncbi:MAG TPA: PQQ-dependent sugar dehydrogenase [Frankiaceae bacterium]|nr:PQQ-dependent sugar dehydrogenase [Frankiaceae bacterium]
MRRILALAVAAATLSAPSPAGAAADPRNVRVALTTAVAGLSGPLGMTYPPGDSRLFVIERAGRIRVVKSGVVQSRPFLDITSRVNSAGEGGLLGLAFRPDFRTSGRFFVAYTDVNMTLRVRRYYAPPTSDVANPTGADVISVPHPTHTNHHGGQLAFGPGGYLFVSTGDGGGSGDPNGNAQNLHSLLGKILRIDVTKPPYAVPPTNPYAGATPGRGEIWASGLRNPWRFSIDGSNLWVGDVGQGAREEIDRFATGGRNLGWDCREGTLNVASAYGGSYCKSTGYTAPIHEYAHGAGDCAVIGGYVYRGSKYATLMGGTYVFGDYCSGRIWLLGKDATGRQVVSLAADFGGNILAFARNAAGEIYLLASNGIIYRLSYARR